MRPSYHRRRRASGPGFLVVLVIVAALYVLDRWDESRRGAQTGGNEVLTAPTRFTAEVVFVSDGDTLTVRGDDRRTVRVRLHAIDAPELNQPAGADAKRALERMVAGRRVAVEPIETDSYGRLVADLRVGTNWVNRGLVAEGWAWHYRHHSDSRELALAERDARQARRGLWSGVRPVAPWNWRQRPENRRPRDRRGRGKATARASGGGRATRPRHGTRRRRRRALGG